MGDGTTVGTYFNEDEQDGLLADFDERFDSRSEAVKDAMAMYLTVDEIIESTGYDFDNERMKRHWIRQAVIDLYRREQDDSD